MVGGWWLVVALIADLADGRSLAPFFVEGVVFLPGARASRPPNPTTNLTFKHS